MINKYQEYIDKLTILRDEDKKLKKEWSGLFYNDVLNALEKYYPVEDVETRSLNWKQKTINSWIGTYEFIKVCWIQKREYGIYVQLYTLYDPEIFLHIIHKDYEGRLTINNANKVQIPVDCDIEEFIEKFVKKQENKIFKRDVKKYNL